MNLFHEDQSAWLAQVSEPIVDPERPIIDPHHHLWPNARGHVYNVDEFLRDLRCGHKVVGTVFMECSTCYRQHGPDEEKSLGETEYVLAQAARLRELQPDTPMLGMVGHVDLRLDRLDAVLDQHIELAGSFFKGIRHAGASARAADRDAMLIPGSAPADLYRQPAFRRGLRRLGARGLSYDTWQYHYQLEDFIDLATACADTVMVLDHFSTPLGVGSFAGRHAGIFPAWRKALRRLSDCDNVFLKLGGLAMPDNGFGWHQEARPPTSDELLAAQGDWYRHALDCFGAERCMFESNFPVDRMSVSYPVYYNAMKKLVAGASESEKDALFAGTARRVYRLAA
jgi:predicted TIM-barrel fold metal-dependent hydrolase